MTDNALQAQGRALGGLQAKRQIVMDRAFQSATAFFAFASLPLNQLTRTTGMILLLVEKGGHSPPVVIRAKPPGPEHHYGAAPSVAGHILE